MSRIDPDDIRGLFPDIVKGLIRQCVHDDQTADRFIKGFIEDLRIFEFFVGADAFFINSFIIRSY